MKSILIVTIIFISLSSFARSNNGHVHLADSAYAILPYDTSDYLFKNGKETTLSKQDLKVAEKLINNAIDEYNHEFDNSPFKNLLIQYNYKMQLVPVINSKGEKEIWINAMCETFPGWREHTISISDGGSCFFNLKINLSKNKHYDMMVNGEA